MLLLGGYIGMALYSDYKRIDAEETARLLTQATVVEQNLGRQLVAVDRSLAAIRDDLPIFTAGKSSRILVERRLQAMSTAMLGVRTILILDASGTAVAGNREQLVGLNFREREYFQAARRGGSEAALYISSPVKTVLGVYAMNVSKVRLDDRGRFAGVIVATLDPEYFQTLLNSVRYAPDMLSSLIHGDGKVVFRVPDPRGIAGLDLAQPGSFFSEQMRTGAKTSVFRGQLPATGEERLAVQRIIRPEGLVIDKPLVIAVSRQLPALSAAWWGDAYRQALEFGALLLVTALGLSFHQRRRTAHERLKAGYEGEREFAEQTLRDSEKRYHDLFDQANEGLVMMTEDGKLFEINRAFAAMHGYTTDEIKHMDISQLDVLGDKTLHERADISRRIQAGEVARFEVEHYHKDGHVFPLNVTVSRINLGGQQYYLAFHQDITERKRAEVETARLAAIVENSNDAIFSRDLEHRISSWNASAERLLGYSAAEVVGKNVHALIVPADRMDEGTRNREQVVQGHVLRDFETVRRTKDGRLIDVSLTQSPIKDERGTVVGFSIILHDISERKRAEMEIAQLAAIVQDSNDAIIGRGLDHTITSWNAAAERLFGYSATEVIGQNLSELIVPPDRLGEVERNRTQVARGKAVLSSETVRRTKDGRLIDVSLTQSPIKNKRGEMVGVSMTFRDITERKRLQEAHVQSQKLESLGTLAGGIAHDFNNILAAIRGNADLAARDVGPNHVAALSLEEIRKAGARASELVRRIMAFGRPKEAKQEVVDLGAVADEVLKLLRSTLPSSIALTRDFAGDAPPVLADSGQVHEAIVNLTTNAAHAIGQRAGSIDYRLATVPVGAKHAGGILGLKEGRYVCLTVTDTGCGMDTGTLERIFDAFYTTKPLGEGTGLGLSMVHGIMRSHGGAITARSMPGKGSSFALYFPAAAAEKASRADDAVREQSPLAAGKRILYVDDEEALILLARRMLSSLGHSVTGFTEPKQALEALREHPQDFDVVVTDLSMPHMSGFDLAREVLALCPGMPVLMSSGYIEEEDEATARAIGIRELILKPMTMD